MSRVAPCASCPRKGNSAPHSTAHTHTPRFTASVAHTPHDTPHPTQHTAVRIPLSLRASSLRAHTSVSLRASLRWVTAFFADPLRSYGRWVGGGWWWWLARSVSALPRVWSKTESPGPPRPAPARPGPARPAPRDKSPDPKRGANLPMKFSKVAHFRTVESPDPKRGTKLPTEFATVAHFRTPESPDPKRGVRLSMKFARVAQFRTP